MIWTSKQSTDQSIYIPYEGPALKMQYVIVETNGMGQPREYGDVRYSRLAYRLLKVTVNGRLNGSEQNQSLHKTMPSIPVRYSVKNLH